MNFIHLKDKERDGENISLPDVNVYPGLSIIRANKFPFHLRQIKKKNKTALLNYNSHTIHFTCLKYTIQWLLIYSQSWTAVTTTPFQS